MQFQPAQEVWTTRSVRWDLVQENELSKRIYQILLKWIPYANEQYKDWDGRPNCGHFFGGNYWYMSDSVSTALVFSVAAKLGAYDEGLTGLPREEVKQKAIRALRYMGFTHDEGPAECVRVKGELPYTSEKKWGGKEEHYFMATQNGRSVAVIAHIALLLWDDLDDETKILVQNVAASYADRWCDVEPGNGSYYDTQCEENAWTSAGISAAWFLFPEHPHAEAWKQGCLNWSLNAVTRTEDRHRYPSGLIDLAEGTSAKTVTFHPDFTTENHAFVHPAYMAAGINLRYLHTSLSMMLGEEALSTFSHNNYEMYESTLKKWVQADGLILPVQGQDWWYNRHHDNHVTHAIINVTEGDRDAAQLERQAIGIIESLQASNTRGCLLEENPEEYVFNRAHGQYANQIEHGSASDLAYSFLLHTFGGPGVEPSEQEEMAERLCGVYEYPFGSVVVHRTAHTVSAFSWRNNVMALSQPSKGMWNITPLYYSFTGTADFTEKKTEEALSNETRILRTEKHRVLTQPDGFSAVATIHRGKKELAQDVSFVSLPNGHAVYIEQFHAAADCRLNHLHTGYLGIRNEAYSAISDLAPGQRTLYADGKETTFHGFYGKAPDLIRDFEPASWVNVDDQIGYLLYGSAGIRYINRHQYERWKGVEDQLILNAREHISFRAGERTEPFIVVSMPNETHERTQAARQQLHVLSTGRTDAASLIHGEYLIYVNFASEPVLMRAETTLTDNRIPLFKGSIELEGSRYRWIAKADAYSSGYVRSPYSLERQTGACLDLKIHVMDDRLLIANESDTPAEFVLCAQEGERKSVTIAAHAYITQQIQ